MNATAILLIPLVVFGLGYGSAWYWATLTGAALTHELTDFSIAVCAFYTALDYIFAGIKKYVARRTAEIKDAEAKERAQSKLGFQLTALTLVIIAAIGKLALDMGR